ncbi:MAG: hypothetical protein MZV70_76010 [Desulfobacterales bacterium]|nr:hypothetical protein [Desulfobacterales bacterium]
MGIQQQRRRVAGALQPGDQVAGVAARSWRPNRRPRFLRPALPGLRRRLAASIASRRETLLVRRQRPKGCRKSLSVQHERNPAHPGFKD